MKLYYILVFLLLLPVTLGITTHQNISLSNATSITNSGQSIFFNYTIPSNDVVYNVKISNLTNSTYHFRLNNTCIDYKESNSDTFEFQFRSESRVGTHIAEMTCYNSTGWQTLFYYDKGAGGQASYTSSSIDPVFDDDFNTFVWYRDGSGWTDNNEITNSFYSRLYEEGIFYNLSYYLEINFDQSTDYTAYFINGSIISGTSTQILIPFQNLSIPTFTVSFNNNTQSYSTYTDDWNTNQTINLQVVTIATYAEPTFRVKDQYHNYVEYATVTATIDGGNYTYSGVTDSNGFITLNLEDSYTYYICAEKDGYSQTDDSCYIAEQSQLDNIADRALFINDNSYSETTINVPTPTFNTTTQVTNTSARRLNLTLSKEIINQNKSTHMQGLFIAIVLCIIFGIIIENKVPNGGPVAFIIGLAGFMFIFEELLWPILLFGLVKLYQLVVKVK